MAYAALSLHSAPPLTPAATLRGTPRTGVWLMAVTEAQLCSSIDDPSGTRRASHLVVVRPPLSAAVADVNAK